MLNRVSVPAQVAKQSNAARSMCLWVRALDVYGRMVKVVEPKRQALHQAEAALAQVEAQLTAKREQLRSGAVPHNTPAFCLITSHAWLPSLFTCGLLSYCRAL